MPIYEYQCSACGHHLEKLQKVSDEALKDCPECHKSTLQKMISSAGFQLKGGGWYVTDFKDKKPKQAADKKEETKADTPKPEKTEKKKEDKK